MSAQVFISAGYTLARVRQHALHSLIPPPRLRLSAWIEQHIVLPEGVSALPGRVRLWPYQREIADAISDHCFPRAVAAAAGLRHPLSAAPDQHPALDLDLASAWGFEHAAQRGQARRGRTGR